jgi:hypothetical protein
MATVSSPCAVDMLCASPQHLLGDDERAGEQEPAHDQLGRVGEREPASLPDHTGQSAEPN